MSKAQKLKKRDMDVAAVFMGKIPNQDNRYKKNATAMSRDHILLKDKGIIVGRHIPLSINRLGNYRGFWNIAA